MTDLLEQKRTRKTGLAGLVSPRVWSELLLLLVGGFDVFEFLCKNDCLKKPYFLYFSNW